MDLGLFLVATFVAAVVTGLVGFAFGLIAAAVWLHILTPLQTATLIIAFGLVVQGYSAWQLRKALDWNRLWPFLLGAAFGVPLGVALLARVDPDYVRRGVAVVLILYSLYALARPAMKPIAVGGATADASVGFCNGVLGGITGLAGILVTIWCGLRGWPKTLAETFEQIRSTMPLRNVRSFDGQTYADILAYILQFNGPPAGNQKLEPNLAVLQQIVIEPLN